MGVKPLLSAVMSAAAPRRATCTPTAGLPGRRCTWEVPQLFALVMSAAAPTSNSHLHTDRWPFWQAMNMSVAAVVRLGDIRGRAHLEQPCTPTGGHSGRRSTWSPASEHALVTSAAAPFSCSHLHTPSFPFLLVYPMGHIVNWSILIALRRSPPQSLCQPRPRRRVVGHGLVLLRSRLLWRRRKRRRRRRRRRRRWGLRHSERHLRSMKASQRRFS